jgi:hypothetical protein
MQPNLTKIKLSLCLIERHAMMIYGGVGGTAFVISALDGGEGSASRHGRLTRREPCTHWIGGWVDPRLVQLIALSHRQNYTLSVVSNKNKDVKAFVQQQTSAIDQWYSTFFVREPPDIISLKLCTPKVVGV